MSDAGDERGDEVDDVEEAAGVEEWIAEEAEAQAGDPGDEPHQPS
jgi:hypothetical protein